MRRRLMLAMVGLVAVTLVVAGAGGLLLTRKAAHDQATSQLVSEADSLDVESAGRPVQARPPAHHGERSNWATPGSSASMRTGTLGRTCPTG